MRGGGVPQKTLVSFTDLPKMQTLIPLKSRKTEVCETLFRGKRSQEYQRSKPHQSGKCNDRANVTVWRQSSRITSLAKRSRDGGIVIPSAWAVLRLMISSNFMACSTGRSAGLAPFRMRST